MPKPARPKALAAMLRKWLHEDTWCAPSQDAETAEKPATEEAQPPTPAAANEHAIDAQAMKEFQLMLAGETGNALKSFLLSSSELMHVLEQGLQADDAAAIMEATHTLKSMCQQVGALELAHSITLLHGLSKNSSLPLQAARPLWHKTQAQYAQAVEALEHYIRDDSNAA